MHLVCTVCTHSKYNQQVCTHNILKTDIFESVLHISKQQLNLLLCALLRRSLATLSQQTAPYGPPLLTIQTARGPPNQAFASLTVILQGGDGGLSAGPVFRVMACPERRAFCAHMEPITSYETDPGREIVRLWPGNGLAALTRPMGRWEDHWFVIWEHSATCVSAP